LFADDAFSFPLLAVITALYLSDINNVYAAHHCTPLLVFTKPAQKVTYAAEKKSFKRNKKPAVVIRT